MGRHHTDLEIIGLIGLSNDRHCIEIVSIMNVNCEYKIRISKQQSNIEIFEQVHMY